MNKTFEKWLTIAALGSWITSMGTLVAIDVSSPQSTLDLSLASESRSYLRRAPFSSVLDSQFSQQKQSDAMRSLESDRSHWLDHTLISREILTQDVSESEGDSLPTLSASEGTPNRTHKLRSVWMLAQLPESWHQASNK